MQIVYEPTQDPFKHLIRSLLIPGHRCPPLEGGGELQSRDRVCVPAPPPQRMREHEVNELHSPQPPCTETNVLIG